MAYKLIQNINFQRKLFVLPHFFAKKNLYPNRYRLNLNYPVSLNCSFNNCTFKASSEVVFRMMNNLFFFSLPKFEQSSIDMG